MFFYSNNLRFPGQYFDAETGLHYNWHRDYYPAAGRYIEADPVGLRGGTNLYAYGLNNPISNIDPDGQVTISIGTVIIVITVAEAVKYCYDVYKCMQAVKNAQDKAIELRRRYPSDTERRVEEFLKSNEWKEVKNRCPKAMVQSYTTP